MTNPPANHTLTVSHKHAEPDPALLEVRRYGATPRVRGYTVHDGIQESIFTFDINPSLLPAVTALIQQAIEGQSATLTLHGWGVTLSAGRSEESGLPQLSVTFGTQLHTWRLQEGERVSEVSAKRNVQLTEISDFLALL